VSFARPVALGFQAIVIMIYTPIRYVCLLLAMAMAANSQAGIVLNTTRIIYPAQDKEVSFGVQNNGGEILLQSWLEATAEETTDLPFIITPALARMPAGSKQLLRIMYAGTDMAQDRESVFWLNVQEIPQAAAENALQIAIRQRIKVLFRPVGLDDAPEKAPEALQWQLQNDTLRVTNPSSYHVSMVRVEAHDGTHSLMKTTSHMLAPKQSLELRLNRPAGDRPITLRFTSINDFGGQVAYHATLNGREAATATVVSKTHRP
jgi:chaperone protein EcpD